MIAALSKGEDAVVTSGEGYAQAYSYLTSKLAKEYNIYAIIECTNEFIDLRPKHVAIDGNTAPDDPNPNILW